MQFTPKMVSLKENHFYNREFFLYFPKREEIFLLDPKANIRRIFEGQVLFEHNELELLTKFEEFLTKAHFNDFPKWSQPAKLRMLYATKFKFDKSLVIMNNYTSWKQKSLPPKETPQAIDFLQSGAIYIHGRDNRFRPILVVNAPKLAARQGQLEVILDAMTILFEFVLANFMLEGQIENWCVILDLGGLGITSLPKSTLQKVMGYLSSNYRSRLYKCYVVNCPSTIMFSWSFVKAFLEDVTVQKVCFEKALQAPSILKHCHSSQIEKKYGGASINLESNFWQFKIFQKSFSRPPKVISEVYLLDMDSRDIFLKEDEYKQLYIDGKLAKNRVCREIVEGTIQMFTFQNMNLLKIEKQEELEEKKEEIKEKKQEVVRMEWLELKEFDYPMEEAVQEIYESKKISGFINLRSIDEK